jgi:hypothetical protein
MTLAPSRAQALAWTAFLAFNKGAFLIYAGQESGATHTPSLFDVDKVAWGDYALQPFLTRLARLKKDPAQMAGEFVLLQAEPAIQAVWAHPDGGLYGVFDVGASAGDVPARLPDGVHTDLLNDTPVEVQNGQMRLSESAVIVRLETEPGQPPAEYKPFYSTMLDYRRHHE